MFARLTCYSPLTGQSIDYARFAGTRGRGGGGRGGYAGNMGGATPGREPQWQGGRTPVPMATGGRTPAWGAGGSSARSMSPTPVIFPSTDISPAPAWSTNASTARTPMWRQDAVSTNGGGRTPAYNAGGDGSRTVNPYADGSRTVNPYGGSTSYGGASGGGGGSRTPAWNPTATSSSYTHDPFSSRTPAHEPSYGRTPGPSYPTPQDTRPYDAPTPGKDFTTAPTPAAHPGNGYAGSTPAAIGGAPTPKFSGDAPTPGWRGEADDEPRYEEGTPSP